MLLVILLNLSLFFSIVRFPSLSFVINRGATLITQYFSVQSFLVFENGNRLLCIRYSYLLPSLLSKYDIPIRKKEEETDGTMVMREIFRWEEGGGEIDSLGKSEKNDGRALISSRKEKNNTQMKQSR